MRLTPCGLQIRMVLANSTVFTLAGGLEGAEVEAGGEEVCPSPCLRGVAGHTDGNLTSARRDNTAVKRDVLPRSEEVLQDYCTIAFS